MKRLLILSFLCTIISSCASYIALPKDTTRFPHNRIKKQVKKGLIIATEDYSSARKSYRYFYRDIFDSGYIPLYICIGNKGKYEFAIRRKNITLRFEDGKAVKAADFKKVIDDSKQSHAPAILSFPLGIIPAFLIGHSITEANDKLDQDYSQKAFHDSYVLKGDNLFGFLFFEVPQGKTRDSLKDATLEVNAIKKATSGELAETLKFIVSIEQE